MEVQVRLKKRLIPNVFFFSSRSRVKGHLQLYVAYIADDGASNSGASGEQTPEDAGWEVVSIDNSSGHEESPAQVRGLEVLRGEVQVCPASPHLLTRRLVS